MSAEITQTAPFDRILAVDLTRLSTEQMEALTQESVRRCIPLSELLGTLVDEMSRRILKPKEVGV